MSNYGIPYMGSKSKIVNDIVPYIISRHTNRNVFVDLFTGGGAVSDWLFKHTKIKVIANDIDENNNHLLAFCSDKDYFRKYAEFILSFVPRDKFHRIRNGHTTDEELKWYVAFVRTVYSFGNRGDSYLYGADIEKQKEVIHNAIVFNDYSGFESIGIVGLDLNLLRKTEIDYGINYREFDIERVFSRANSVLGIIYDFMKGKIDDATLNRITVSEHLSRIKRLYDFMDKDDNTIPVDIETGDYRTTIDNITKASGTNDLIVYCDPPYEDTAEYVVGSFDSSAFWDWVRSTKNKYPVYISSYKAPPDIECVWEQGKRGLFAMNSENNGKIVEKIFYNGFEEKDETLFDLLMQS